MNKKNIIVNDTIFLTLSKFFTLFIGIFITMTLSKNLSLYDYGTYSQGILIVTFFASLTILGLTDATNFFFNIYGDAKREEFLSTILFIQSIIGIVVALIIYLFSSFFSWYFENDTLSSMAIYFAFMPMFINLISIIQIVYISIGKSKLIAIRNLVLSIIKLTLIYFAIFIKLDIYIIFFILLTLDVTQFFFLSIYLRKIKKLLFAYKIRLKLIPVIFKYSIPMALAILINTLNRDIDKLVIGRFTDTETLAVYSNASRILPFDIIAISLITILIPYITRYMSNQNYNKAIFIIKNYISFSLISTWILAFGIVLFSKESIIFLYGLKYVDGRSIFIIYVIVDMVRFANISIILSSSGNSKKLMIYSAYIIVLNLVLNLCLFFLLGVSGPAIATLISSIIYYGFIIKDSARILKTKVNMFLDYKLISKLILYLGLCMIIYTLYNRLIGIYPSNNTIRLMFTYGIYLSFSLIFFYREIKFTLLKFDNLDSLQ